MDEYAGTLVRGQKSNVLFLTQLANKGVSTFLIPLVKFFVSYCKL
jgi:hypothetical protein